MLERIGSSKMPYDALHFTEVKPFLALDEFITSHERFPHAMGCSRLLLTLVRDSERQLCCTQGLLLLVNKTLFKP